jgi:hypothetical protein
VFYVQAMPEGAQILEPFAAVRRAHAAMAVRASYTATMPPMA